MKYRLLLAAPFLLQFESQKLVLFEAGCGVGNCIFPLLENDLNIFVYACDFSPRAVDFVKVRRDCFKSRSNSIGKCSIKVLEHVFSFPSKTLCTALSVAARSSVT